jgi:hypothetical protein
VWYWGLAALALIWLGIDGWQRRSPLLLLWIVGVLLLWPLVLPIYLAERPLKHGETREGGRAWNILRNFALTWTVLLLGFAVAYLMTVSSATQSIDSDAGRVGAGIGVTLVFVLLAAVWFFPMFGAIVLGYFLRKTALIERGPTGPLAEGEPVASEYPSAGPRGSYSEAESKVCPQCAEAVRAAARICRFCGHQFAN